MLAECPMHTVPKLLRVKCEKAEEKVSEFRDKLKDARLEISSKDRQLDVAKRMIQRLNAEKSDVEVRRDSAANGHGVQCAAGAGTDHWMLVLLDV